MSSPVDIKAVLDAMGATEAARNQAIRVHVYFDQDARPDLCALAKVATRREAENATVLYDQYPDAHALPDATADMALLVAHDSGRTGELYANLQSLGVPCAVIAIDADVLVHDSHALGHSVAERDILSPTREYDSGALADRSVDSEIGLDTTAATDLLTQFGNWVVEVFKEKRLAFAHAFACVRRPLALESVNATAVQNAGIGVVAIIPGADMPLMTLNQMKMLLEIAGAYGEELSLGRMKEILTVIGGAFACRALARQLVGFVPAVGWAVKGGVGYAGTIAMGHALLEYFESGASVSEAARHAADKARLASTSAGVDANKNVAENAFAVAAAVKEATGKLANSVTSNAIPAATKLAKSATEATGFGMDDVLGAVSATVGKVFKRL